MGRRSHERFAVRPTSEGVVRVLRDVVVQQSGERELLAISSEPGTVQAAMMIELHDEPGGGEPRVLKVRVVESQPLVMGGAVRHRLVLEVMPTGLEVGGPQQPPPGDAAWQR
jgi:hypothetical protein